MSHASGQHQKPEAITLIVPPDFARLLSRLQQLRNSGAPLVTVDLRTLELYPALTVEHIALRPK